MGSMYGTQSLRHAHCSNGEEVEVVVVQKFLDDEQDPRVVTGRTAAEDKEAMNLTVAEISLSFDDMMRVYVRSSLMFKSCLTY